jgi:hypothetical protein
MDAVVESAGVVKLSLLDTVLFWKMVHRFSCVELNVGVAEVFCPASLEPS